MLLRTPTTPWVRDQLAADPMDAMLVESLFQTDLDGTVRLFGKSSHGPFLAIVHSAGGGFDGYRGTGRTLGEAMGRAIERAQAGAAA